MNLGELSSEEILANLHGLLRQGRALLARLLAYLGEVEERRLDLRSACSSLFDFCIHKLGMSDDEASRRVTASRLARRFPIALGMIERGEIHMTAFLLMREYLTEANHEELLRAASGKTKVEVRELLAARFPRRDVPSLIQELPVQVPVPVGPRQGPAEGVPEKASRVEPLSPVRYKVQFTATAELKAKLERAANLMRHANPNGELSVVVDRAIDLLLEQLEKRRLGKTKGRPRIQVEKKETRPGYVEAAVRRDVFGRDGEQCSFMDESGQRCRSRAFLELDHKNPRARGGADDAANVRIVCRSHNRLAAELHFGRDYIEMKKAQRQGDPRQRGKQDEAVVRALTGMGFKQKEARRAIGIVEGRWTGLPPPLETMVREAIGVLT